MRKIIYFFVMILLCLYTFLGCEEKEYLELEYSSEKLINKETPDPSLVFAGRMETPTKGISIFEFSDSRFFGIVENGSIREVKFENIEDHTKEYSSYEILNISKKEFSKKFNVAIPKQDHYIWEDTVLCHFYVPEDRLSDGEPVEYAGKYIFAEYREKDDSYYFQAVSSEDFCESALYTNYRGRIGDRFYLQYGFYDLTTNSYKCYEDETELPLYYGMTELHSGSVVLKKLREDDAIKDHIPEGMYPGGAYQIKNRIYMILGDDERYYDGEESEPVYTGSSLMVLMLDSETLEVLYAERYNSSNYNIGVNLSLYRMGKDGILYDPYYVD